MRGDAVRGDFGRSDEGRGGMSGHGEDNDNIPTLPERKYSAL